MLLEDKQDPGVGSWGVQVLVDDLSSQNPKPGVSSALYGTTIFWSTSKQRRTKNNEGKQNPAFIPQEVVNRELNTTGYLHLVADFIYKYFAGMRLQEEGR